MNELVDGGAGPDGPPAIACVTSASCPASAPVCDPEDAVCRVCVADSECPGACHELTGHCLAESEVLYASPTGADNVTCAKATPCKTIDAALSRVTATRSFIRVADGSYDGEWNVKQTNGSAPAVIMSGTDADPAGAVFAPGNNGSLETDGNTTVVIEGITFADSQQASLVVRGKATLSRVVVTRANGIGIDVRPAGSLVLLDSRVSDGENVGIASLNSLEVQRSQVLGNTGGGISASGGYTIVNTIIANNGTMLGGMYGGARLAPGQGKPAVFRFNTVTKNTGGSMAPGVQCDSPATLESSIISGNNVFVFPEIGQSCAPKYCLLETASGNNVQGNPMFVNAASDFHLMAGSPAIDKADPAATEAVDYEGGGRPSGGARDIGADERP